MAPILFEMITPERMLLLGDARVVMLPDSKGDMSVMPGHDAAMKILNPGVFAVTDSNGHRAFVRGSFVQITGDSVLVLIDRALPLEEFTRERLDERSFVRKPCARSCSTTGFATSQITP